MSKHEGYTDEEWDALQRLADDGHGSVPLVARQPGMRRLTLPEMKQIAETHFPPSAGMVLKADTTDTVVAGVIVDSHVDVIIGEPVAESDTQLLRRLLDEFDVFSDEVHGNADKMVKIRQLAKRCQRDAQVDVLKYILTTVFNDEIKSNSKFRGRIGEQKKVREDLLKTLGDGIMNQIKAIEQSV